MTFANHMVKCLDVRGIQAYAGNTGGNCMAVMIEGDIIVTNGDAGLPEYGAVFAYDYRTDSEIEVTSFSPYDVADEIVDYYLGQLWREVTS